MGEYAGAIEALGGKLSRHKKAKDFYGVLITSLLIADAYRMEGRHDAAHAVIQEAIRLAQKYSYGKWLLHAHMTSAVILHDWDRFEEALTEGE